MTPKLRSNEDGFTLIELLVVILIVGILAAIALPTFLGQQKKGQDSAAKSDVRNLVTHVESCFADTQDYTACGNTKLGTTGLNVAAADNAAPTKGQVSVEATAVDGYTITAQSQSTNTFSIKKTAGGPPARSCTPATGNSGGCKAGSW